MEKINYKSDFNFILRLADCQGKPLHLQMAQPTPSPSQNDDFPY